MHEIQKDDKFEIIYKPEKATYSGHQLAIIPTNPNFEPDKIQQRKAIKFLVEKYEDNEIRSILTNQIGFIDSGENFESVACNHCGQNIAIEFWQNEMDSAYQTGFADLAIITPCCNKKTTLNDLNYNFPSGFSKYQLLIIDPNYDSKNENDIKEDLKQILGKEVRLIWTKY